jgi:glycosyltransferase involved in cell wall biosynthesis
VEFAAVPTWGTTNSDLTALRRHPNITVLGPVDDIDEVFRQTRVALVPSLWAEARSRIILEAMVRGIPVLSSNVGGLAEAMLGMDYLLPINPVVQYQAAMDELMVPLAEIPRQDIGPWRATLERLITDPAPYEALSVRCRRAALAYARNLNALPFEEYLRQIVQLPKRSMSGNTVAVTTPAGDELSPAKRRLLAQRLRRRSE